MGIGQSRMSVNSGVGGAAPSELNEEKKPSGVKQSDGARKEDKSALALYRSGQIFEWIPHKHRENISKGSSDKIANLDYRILNAIATGKPKELSGGLDALLDLPFFQSPGVLPTSQLKNYFNGLDRAKVGDPDNRNKHANDFASAFVTLAKSTTSAGAGSTPEAFTWKDIQAKAFSYLNTPAQNRSTFQRELLFSAFPNVKLLRESMSTERRSAQKRGLETFGYAFPAMLAANRPVAVELLKKLLRSIPNLEHHERAERCAQLRGLEVIKGAFGHLDAYETADVLAEAMETVSRMSTESSKMRLSFQPDQQAQGMALNMLRDQLKKLRKDWKNVNIEKQNKLIRSFEGMKSRMPDYWEVNEGTLRKFFKDDSINPSLFGQSSKKPTGSNQALVFVRGYEKATGPEKTLIDTLRRLYSEAKELGVHSALPSGLLETLRNYKDSTNQSAADNFCKCLERIIGKNSDCLLDYESPLTRRDVLKKITEMTQRLAEGDQQFLDAFVPAIHNASLEAEPSQTWRTLSRALLIDKARKGHDSLNDMANLLRLGVSVYREQQLHEASKEVIGDPLPFYERNAIDNCLGKKLGLPDPIDGETEVDDGASKKAATVTHDQLRQIEKDVEERMKQTDGLVNFLSTWTPLTERINNTSSSDLENQPEATGEVNDGTLRASEGKVLQERITEILNKYPSALNIDEEKTILSTKQKEIASYSSPTVFDLHAFSEFCVALAIEKSLTDTSDYEAPSLDEAIKLLYTPAPSSSDASTSVANTSPFKPSQSPISISDIHGYAIVPNSGGGNCMYYALGANENEVSTWRSKVAGAILARPETEAMKNGNTQQVLHVLLQTPQTQKQALGLIEGTAQIPNALYAQFVQINGMYSGIDELMAHSTLSENLNKKFFVIDSNGTLTTVFNGVSTGIKYMSEDQKKTLLNANLADADVVLFKTEEHWVRMERTNTGS